MGIAAAAYDNGLASLERRDVDIQARLERRRESLVAQFVKMESLIGRLQRQGSGLTSPVDALNGSRSN